MISKNEDFPLSNSIQTGVCFRIHHRPITVKFFRNCLVQNTGLQNQTEKVPCTLSLDGSNFLSSLCLQRLFWTFNGCDYCMQCSVLILKKTFSGEIDKNDIYLGGASKQNTLFQKICPKKCTHTPNVQNRPWFKVRLSPSKKIWVVCFIESPLKMMNNAFYLILKALFVLKIFKVFIMTFWSSRKSDLIRKIRLISKFMTSQPG